MRDPLHSICPYFAMFPESFVQKHVLAYSRPGERLFDPFCGRGTTILEGLLNNRQAIGSDINPVAACVAGAKANVPNIQEVVARIDDLEAGFKQSAGAEPPPHEFFGVCFSRDTLQHVLYLRESLRWRDNRIDRFIAAIALGVLHGESHKTDLCLSNRMPRTISTKPDYSVRWWQERNLMPPVRDAFHVLRKCALFRLAGKPPPLKGDVVLTDAREAGLALKRYRNTVSLVVTSPPYLDTTDYAEDQWLRLWFLGGPPRPWARRFSDDRHTSASLYWRFLAEVWAGCAPLLRDDCRVVVRIGGTLLSKGELLGGLQTCLDHGLAGRKIRPLHAGETSAIRRRQTNSFRPGTSAKRTEHDFAFSVS